MESSHPSQPFFATSQTAAWAFRHQRGEKTSDTLQTRITLLLSFNSTSTRINVNEINQSIVRLLCLIIIVEILSTFGFVLEIFKQPWSLTIPIARLNFTVRELAVNC